NCSVSHFLGVWENKPQILCCWDVYVRQYHYVDLELSWTNAQLHCREKFSDLATFSSSDDLSRLPETTFRAAWFGMTDHSKSWKNIFNNDSNSWKWSASGEWSVPSYQNWFPGQPDNDGSAQTCVYVLGGGKWIDGYCEEKKNFVCFNARDYCREHHIDLAMIESQRENEQFLLEKHTPLVWIGMYRVPWRWSDGSTSLFRNWRDGQPNNFNGEQHCGVIKMSHVWDDDNCDNAKPFFCQKSKTFTSSCWSTSFPIPLFLAPVQVRKTKLVSPHLLLFSSGEWSVPSYQNWFPGQPDNDGSAQTCVYVLSGGKWIDGYCEEKKNFVCFNGKN
uniref:C-type lectin domain-containing protein n=1 Tax=Gouania willdenowi TaxID=441366 RepID=A0A8C5EEW5_GOUWI